jgi:tetratricopeptide (TPR) repeat protein
MLDRDSLLSMAQEKSFQSLKRAVEGMVELANIYQKKLDVEENNVYLEKLIDMWKTIQQTQLDAIERAKYDGGNPDEEKIIYSSYCETLANLMIESNMPGEKSKAELEEAMKYNPSKIEIMLDLAEVDYFTGDIEAAESKCSKVLKGNPNHPWALKLLSEILLTQNEIEKGIQGFEKVCGRDPSNYTALGCLFEFYRRDGQLDKIKEILDHLEGKHGKSTEPGYCYVKGLYYFYRKNPSEALVNLYHAKRNRLYKDAACKLMMGIYLNPDQDLLYNTENEKTKPFKKENIESMELLIDELADIHFGLERQVYNSYASLYLKANYMEVEEVLNQMATEEPTFIPALNCLAMCKLMKPKGGVDKAVLKNISKNKYNSKWGEEAERGWLQVGEFLITAKNYEFAEREFLRCLKYNKSSSKAYEMLGSLSEKTGKAAEAVRFYNMAWAVSENRDSSIGFRLASLYFKQNNFVNSIIISKKVLAINPTYPKIKDEILDKARDKIRP